MYSDKQSPVILPLNLMRAMSIHAGLKALPPLTSCNQYSSHNSMQVKDLEDLFRCQLCLEEGAVHTMNIYFPCTNYNK